MSFNPFAGSGVKVTPGVDGNGDKAYEIGGTVISTPENSYRIEQQTTTGNGLVYGLVRDHVKYNPDGTSTVESILITEDLINIPADIYLGGVELITYSETDEKIKKYYEDNNLDKTHKYIHFTIYTAEEVSSDLFVDVEDLIHDDAVEVNVDTKSMSTITSTNVQGALEELDSSVVDSYTYTEGTIANGVHNYTVKDSNDISWSGSYVDTVDTLTTSKSTDGVNVNLVRNTGADSSSVDVIAGDNVTLTQGSTNGKYWMKIEAASKTDTVDTLATTTSSGVSSIGLIRSTGADPSIINVKSGDNVTITTGETSGVDWIQFDSTDTNTIDTLTTGTTDSVAHIDLVRSTGEDNSSIDVVAGDNVSITTGTTSGKNWIKFDSTDTDTDTTYTYELKDVTVGEDTTNNLVITDSNGNEKFSQPYASEVTSYSFTVTSGDKDGSVYTFQDSNGVSATFKDHNTQYNYGVKYGTGDDAGNLYTTLIATSSTTGDKVQYVAGDNISIIGDATNDTLTFSATNTTYTLEKIDGYVYLKDSSGTAVGSFRDENTVQTLKLDETSTQAQIKLVDEAQGQYGNITFKAGDNITITKDSSSATGGSITISAGDTTYTGGETLYGDIAISSSDVVTISQAVGRQNTLNSSGEIFNDYTYNTALGDYSSATGYNNHTSATGSYSFVTGRQNTCNSLQTLMAGFNNVSNTNSDNTKGLNSFVVGYENTITTQNGITGGRVNTVCADSSLVCGASITAGTSDSPLFSSIVIGDHHNIPAGAASGLAVFGQYVDMLNENYYPTQYKIDDSFGDAGVGTLYIGGGTGSRTGNLLVLDNYGNLQIKGSLMQDYVGYGSSLLTFGEEGYSVNKYYSLVNGFNYQDVPTGLDGSEMGGYIYWIRAAQYDSSVSDDKYSPYVSGLYRSIIDRATGEVLYTSLDGSTWTKYSTRAELETRIATLEGNVMTSITNKEIEDEIGE